VLDHDEDASLLGENRARQHEGLPERNLQVRIAGSASLSDARGQPTRGRRDPSRTGAGGPAPVLGLDGHAPEEVDRAAADRLGALSADAGAPAGDLPDDVLEGQLRLPLEG
jgi:hypothetical protein